MHCKVVLNLGVPVMSYGGREGLQYMHRANFCVCILSFSDSYQFYLKFLNEKLDYTGIFQLDWPVF